MEVTPAGITISLLRMFATRRALSMSLETIDKENLKIDKQGIIDMIGKLDDCEKLTRKKLDALCNEEYADYLLQV